MAPVSQTACKEEMRAFQTFVCVLFDSSNKAQNFGDQEEIFPHLSACLSHLK